MPEINKRYAPGTPCWVDIGVSDLARSKKFYGQLFGWTFQDSGAEMGHYNMATVNGHEVAGLMRNPSEEMPIRWTTYLATDDIDATLKKITTAGGKVLMGPMNIPGSGRMAMAMDCCDASFGLWQEAGFPGSRLVNEPGSPVWNELMSRDVDRARKFYQEVFGYEYGKMDDPEMDYTTTDVNGRPVGGIYDGNGVAPEGMPSNWSVCFAVADADGLVVGAEKLGAKVVAKPMNSPYGRYASMVDLDGAYFSIMQVTTTPQEQRQQDETAARK
jgi:predicted enzyme related to lactoylglutathione lyase